MTAAIRYVAHDDKLENKLRQATSIIRMRHLGTSLDEWDGQACDVLIADAQNHDGKTAIADAYGRGIPVVAVGAHTTPSDGVVNLSPETSVQGVTRVIDDVLRRV